MIYIRWQPDLTPDNFDDLVQMVVIVVGGQHKLVVECEAAAFGMIGIMPCAYSARAFSSSAKARRAIASVGLALVPGARSTRTSRKNSSMAKMATEP